LSILGGVALLTS